MAPLEDAFPGGKKRTADIIEYELALRVEMIARMDPIDVQAAILRRHNLSAAELFKKPPSDDPDEFWHRDELAKLALCRLEGVPYTQRTDFFTREFSRLAASHHQDEEQALDEASTRTATKKMTEFFSSQLLAIIHKREREYSRVEELTLNAEARAEIERISELLHVPVEKLFSGRPIPRNAQFTALELVRAFRMRAEHSPTKNILAALGRTGTKEALGRAAHRLIVLTSEMFSPEAVRKLP